jgi:hypothetical protein
MAELDGIVLLLARISFAGKEIGLISEDGVEWGGDPPEYLKISAAQVRGAVVKKVLKRAGSIDLTFRLIELKVQNLVDVIGGTIDATTSKWNAPALPVLKEGPLEIESVTGQIISASKATISGDFSGTIGADDPLGVDVTISIMSDGVTSPFSIDNTEPVSG